MPYGCGILIRESAIRNGESRAMVAMIFGVKVKKAHYFVSCQCMLIKMAIIIKQVALRYSDLNGYSCLKAIDLSFIFLAALFFNCVDEI